MPPIPDKVLVTTQVVFLEFQIIRHHTQGHEMPAMDDMIARPLDAVNGLHYEGISFPFENFAFSLIARRKEFTAHMKDHHPFVQELFEEIELANRLITARWKFRESCDALLLFLDQQKALLSQTIADFFGQSDVHDWLDSNIHVLIREDPLIIATRLQDQIETQVGGIYVFFEIVKHIRGSKRKRPRLQVPTALVEHEQESDLQKIAKQFPLLNSTNFKLGVRTKRLLLKDLKRQSLRVSLQTTNPIVQRQAVTDLLKILGFRDEADFQTQIKSYVFCEHGAELRRLCEISFDARFRSGQRERQVCDKLLAAINAELAACFKLRVKRISRRHSEREGGRPRRDEHVEPNNKRIYDLFSLVSK